MTGGNSVQRTLTRKDEGTHFVINFFKNTTHQGFIDVQSHSDCSRALQPLNQLGSLGWLEVTAGAQLSNCAYLLLLLFSLTARGSVCSQSCDGGGCAVARSGVFNVQETNAKPLPNPRAWLCTTSSSALLQLASSSRIQHKPQSQHSQCNILTSPCHTRRCIRLKK